MKNTLFIVLIATLTSSLHAQIPDLTENVTPTYQEVIALYKNIDESSDYVKMKEYGMTDSGHPLHLVIINKDKEFDPVNFGKDKVIFLINNAIHPGEPCGVNASLHIANEMSKGNLLPENVIVAIIPAYNIGGMLNRNSNSRANQNGPEEYGFRGNAQNLDLNRDFIKADSKTQCHS